MFYEKYINDSIVPVSDRMELFQEIKSFGMKLKALGLKLSDLSKYTPKCSDSRDICVNIAKKIADDKSIYKQILNNKQFPVKELSEIFDVNSRTIKGNRKFIVSIAIIYGNNYLKLQAYLERTICSRDTVSKSGLILEMGNNTITLLSKDNGYYKLLRKPTMYISQEIQFKSSDVINMFYFL